MPISLQTILRKLDRLKNLSHAQSATYLSNRLLNNIKGVIKDRIFEQGLDSNLSKIGFYSTQPFRLTPPTSPEYFFPYNKLTKYKVSAWESIYNTLGGVSLGGTVSLREAQGLQSTFVDLTYTGRLKESVQVRALGNVIEVYISDSVNQEKMEWLEEHFKCTIFQFHVSELERIRLMTVRNLRLFIRDILQ